MYIYKVYTYIYIHLCACVCIYTFFNLIPQGGKCMFKFNKKIRNIEMIFPMPPQKTVFLFDYMQSNLYITCFASLTLISIKISVTNKIS